MPFYLSDLDVSIKNCCTIQHQNIEHRAINAGGSTSEVFSSIKRPFANERNVSRDVKDSFLVTINCMNLLFRQKSEVIMQFNNFQ